MSAIKVRGIYSSAITNFLSKNKLKIAQPSDNVKNTFPKTKFEEEYNTLIYDFSDKGGIIVKGEETEKVCKLFKKFQNVIIQTENTGHIYLGHIIRLDPNTKNIHVDLGMKKPGLLPLKDYWGYVKEGEKILVQLKNEEKDCFVLSTKIHLFGNNVVLIQKGFTKISNHIKDKEVINKLNNVAQDNCEEGWGALWKTSASDKEEKELSKEIKDLYKEYEKLKNSFEKEEKIQILSKGISTCYIRFDKTVKAEMDKLRNEAKPTLDGHHSLKTDIFANIVDFSENLLKEKVDAKKINKQLKEFVSSKSARVGDVFLITEHKINGSTNFMKGRIIEKEEDKVVIKRFLKSGSTIQPINMIVERGDYVKTTAKNDEWSMKHEVYSKEDELKTEYYTINTPIEIHSNKAVTNSLEVSVYNNEILNQEAIEEHVKNEVISKELNKEIIKIAKKLNKSDKK